MSYSLNEVEATAKRAARGAGYSWGLAEEAGKAARWLCARDLDGCAALARLLDQFQGDHEADWTPITEGAQWQAAAGRLCPLLTGAAISDRANSLQNGNVSLEALVEPILLIPFAASCARRLQKVVSIDFSQTNAVTDGDALSVDGRFPALADEATVTIGGKIATPQPQCSRAKPSPETWQVLNRFAQRTYAPATEESRLTGAGAGLSDND